MLGATSAVYVTCYLLPTGPCSICPARQQHYACQQCLATPCFAIMCLPVCCQPAAEAVGLLHTLHAMNAVGCVCCRMDDSRHVASLPKVMHACIMMGVDTPAAAGGRMPSNISQHHTASFSCCGLSSSHRLCWLHMLFLDMLQASPCMRAHQQLMGPTLHHAQP